MNFLDQEDSSSDLCCFNFNQDGTTLAVGMKKGYKLFDISSINDFSKVYESIEKTVDEVYIVERLYSSSLLATVRFSSPRTLYINHIEKRTNVCSYSYHHEIMSVKLNRAIVVSCLQNSLVIHDIKVMKVIHAISDIPYKLNGKMALSTNIINSYIAYPGSETVGIIQIFDAVNLRGHLTIQAHNSELALFTFDESGTKLATSSRKGTVIRVFNVNEGSKIIEFRRGLARCATIYSLSFSSKSLFLSASSNTETIHIFKLPDPNEPKVLEEPQGWVAAIANAFILTATAYLPTQVTEVLNQDRAFATITLPFSEVKNICSLVVLENVLRVYVAAANGLFYIYDFDGDVGGPCTLVKQHRFNGDENEEWIQSSSTVLLPPTIAGNNETNTELSESAILEPTNKNLELG